MSEATFEAALESATPNTLSVEIPEWGGWVTVRRAMLADLTWLRTQAPDGDISRMPVEQFQTLLLVRLIVAPQLGAEAATIISSQPIPVFRALVAAMDRVAGVADGGVADATQFRPEDDA